MPPKTPLIDAIRTVPEVAVRLWAGGQVLRSDDAVRIVFEGSSVTVTPEMFEQAMAVARILSVRWSGRLLRSISDVLDLRHAAEDVFTEELFGRSRLPKVLFVPAGTTASGYYRAMIPSDLLFAGGRTLAHWTSKVDLAKVLRYDVLWIQLLTSPILAEIARQAQAQGVRVVYDIDDRLDAIPDENQAKTVYGTPEKQAEIDEMMRLVDCITVSTEPLRRHLAGKYPGKDIRTLPNMLTANVIPRRHPPNPDYVRILWAGSATHKRDLAIVAPVLREILLERNGKVRFTLFGERMPEALTDCYRFVDLKEPVDFDSYHDAIASIGADFGIAPLEDNPFNETKSAIKALEYAAAGYPMLLSPVGEYPAVVEAGLPAELVPVDGWPDALRRMIDLSVNARASLGRACTDWVMANRCIVQVKAAPWEAVIADLTATRAEARPEVAVPK